MRCGSVSSAVSQMKGQEEMALNCARGGSYWILEKKNITGRVFRHWNKFLREVVETVSLEKFQRHLDVALRRCGLGVILVMVG